MAGVRKLPSGKMQAWFIDWQGRQKFLTHGRNAKAALHVAENLENTHRRMRLGELPPPKSSDTPRSFAEVAEEYIEFGTAQGGHGGRKWSPVHRRMRTRHLTKFWPEHLHPVTLSDISLPKVEKVARELQAKGLTGKTVSAHIESLKSLCVWAKGRGYLDVDPLEGMTPFDATPQERRRALTEEELARLLNVAPADRRIVYEVAVCTGYRKGELQALTVGDLDTINKTLPLRAEFCKGRRDSRQPIPAALVEKLKALVMGKAPSDKLLHVPMNMDRFFHRDREAAGIAKTLMGQTLVFHSLRHTYCTLVMESGANLIEAQRLMRHTDPKLTANTYSHARADRLQSVAEAVGDKALFVEKYAPTMHTKAAGSESLVLTTTCNAEVVGSTPSSGIGLGEQTFVRLSSNFRNLPMRIAKLGAAMKILLSVFSQTNTSLLCLKAMHPECAPTCPLVPG
jgi:integrase